MSKEPITKKISKKKNKKHLNGKDNLAFDSGGGKLQPDGLLNPKFTEKESRPSEHKKVSYFQLFRFATCWELAASILGIILSAVASLGVPLGVILYGEFTTLLVDRESQIGSSTPTLLLWIFGGGHVLTNATMEENRSALLEDSVAFGFGAAAISVFQFVFAAISVDILNYSALKQIGRIRQLFLESVLRQDMSWYDTSTSNNFAVRMTDDLDKLKEGIGDKLAVFIYLVMSFIFSVIFAFFYGWKLTLVILSCAPIIILATAFVAKIQSSLTEKELQSYATAGSVAEEVLGGIRTVIAFGGESKESDRYRERLLPAESNGQKKGLFSGIGSGIMWLIVYCCYALAFWYGVGLILDDRTKDIKEYTPAVLIIVLFGVLAGAQNLGLTSPHLESFATARGSAAAIYSVINRMPLIDSMGVNGLKPKTMHGDIEFSNVHFKYPARSDVKVVQGLSLSIKAGQTVAFVGPSGCGKSTCLQLIQRLYDPLEGDIKIDGVKVTELNTAWLRSFIGVVGQEPVLFATTIGENIRYGNPEVTQEEIQKAAVIANCHDFIAKLPNGYDTMVGERGAQISGGQKQRIAIARALVRNPKILLLDEATSALDPHSEKLVQDALEKASKGRTTLIVSHRMTTITDADLIVFVNKGVVGESGTHDELMTAKGLYYDLVEASKGTPEDENDKNIKSRKRHLSYSKSKSIIDELSKTENADSELSSDESENEEEEDDEPEEPENDEEVYPVSVLRLLKLNSPEWPYILVGCISAIIAGASLPAFAILFGEFYGILSMEDAEQVSADSNGFSVLFIVLGIVTGLGTFFQTYMFNIAGVRLTSRLRQKVFSAMMYQEMGWFDRAKNSVGALCVRLAGDCASVQGATGTRIGSLLQAFSTIAIGAAISFYFSWKLTLVSIITVPVVLSAVFFESRYMDSSSNAEKLAMEDATKIAVESISNIRTVASLCQEPHILKRYIVEIEKVQQACRNKIRFRGTVFSFGQAAPFMGYGLALYYGGTLVATEGLEYKNVIKVSEALIFGSWMLGQALAYAPNVNSAIISAGRLFKLLDRVPKITSPPPIPYNQNWKTEGNINFNEVMFRYPTRPAIPILQGLKLDIQKGQTVALVGPSGCGKSTCIQLLLRYYDADEGQVTLDGTPTTEYPVHRLRSQMGFVSQEPVLFDRTIAENIAYGDNSRDIPMTEIMAAARMANIHDFVSGLPLGYETSLGTKGAQLSGGQKQRIAIARALVRNPRVLLLDEATSALDTQSEKIVQAALDQARTGRTCIIIAHRLTTIQNADVICVLQNGVIAERGTHTELLALGKLYAKLQQMQQ